ncbi:MAG: CBS domain-containing protein [Gemmatimonadetes bacterium]|nr:CBS domain-containing protein [Gemmatimonadota bacterium]MBT8404599.1 CBS domain-containing protein [Gemmatimonadota bacterium]NNK63251.1 CBS domain-containing protein [Gemmatimonadota bacterium]
MGQDLVAEQTPDAFRAFTRALLRDLQALERMLDSGMIESGIRRIGAEQEFFLVGRGWRPASTGVEVLKRLGEPFTPELARFNLEVNLEPSVLEGDAFSRMEARLDELMLQAREAARAEGSEVCLTGILPTLTKADLTLENITPRARYYALNDALARMRGGGVFRLRIEGTDELLVEHDSVMLESCNTSAQVHLQVSAEEFVPFYNMAQAITGPVLAAAVNSPLLFGKRLWAETRIALFQQSLDTRSGTMHLREMSPRVRFGDRWIHDSVIDLFQEDIARFRVLLATNVDEDPIAILDAGGIPKLQALQLHNGTVYRWNRPCYGISDGKPHLRIECRTLPSGPTVLDEVANAAFWIGAVLGGVAEYGDITEVMDFDDVKGNCAAAAKLGLKAAMNWVGGQTVSAPDLILGTLLPLARRGLDQYGVRPADIDRYLGVIADRVESGQTGATWAMRSLTHMKDQGTRGERLAAVTAASVRLQQEAGPVHRWPLAELEEAGGWKLNYLRVEQYMTTYLFTVHEDELVQMVAFLMDRKQIRHVLVEDDNHRLVGLVSYRSVLRLISQSGGEFDEDDARPVKMIMDRDPVTVTPETATLEAIELMRDRRVSCLPVVDQGKLVGIVSERDFMPIAYQLLEERLREAEE